MPLVKEIHIEKGLLLLWEITEELEPLKAEFPTLNTDLTFKSLKNLKRQKEWLAVKMMLKHAGCSDFKVSYSSLGQPHIEHPQYQQVSISHSDKLAGVLFHQDTRVGLDIESLDRNFIGIEKKYLSPAEIKLAYQTENGHCLFWCSKEAVYKTAGVAGIHFADQIALMITNERLYAKLKTDKITTTFQLHYFDYKKHFIAYVIDHE